MAEGKKILCIVPLPPPVTGAGAVSETAVKFLSRGNRVTVINCQRDNLVSGDFNPKQAFNILRIGLSVLKLRAGGESFDRVYLVVSSSFWGHVRDLFFLLALGKDLRRKTAVHLHSSNARGDLSAILPALLKPLGRRLFADVRKGIVVGETWKTVYGGYLDGGKVAVINNFFAPELLIPEEELSAKYQAKDRTAALFLSNMIRMKGYETLFDAFMDLPRALRDSAELHFAGRFDKPEERAEFLERIRGNDNVLYHGEAAGAEKISLFRKAHLFCFPSMFREAQPLSILEAYAAGCAVLTVESGGIKDIFTDNRNGFAIGGFGDRALMRDSLRAQLERALADRAGCERMAALNRREAVWKYSIEKFGSAIEAALE